MLVDVVDTSMKKVGQVDLKDTVFATKEAPYLWHELVKWQLASKRQGTASTKTRNEVKGSTRKIFRQKGTGNARHGSKKAPIFVGGGTVFGPKNRDYSYDLNKKTKKKALCSALSMKNNKGLIKVLDKIELKEIKTKEALKVLSEAKFNSALVVDIENDVLARAVRNLSNFKYIKPEGLNVYDLMKFDGLIVSKEAIESIQERLA